MGFVVVTANKAVEAENLSVYFLLAFCASGRLVHLHLGMQSDRDEFRTLLLPLAVEREELRNIHIIVPVSWAHMSYMAMPKFKTQFSPLLFPKGTVCFLHLPVLWFPLSDALWMWVKTAGPKLRFSSFLFSFCLPIPSKGKEEPLKAIPSVFSILTGEM